MGALTLKNFSFILRGWNVQSFESFDISDSFGQDTLVYINRNQVVTIEPNFSDEAMQSWLLYSIGSRLLEKIDIESLLSNLVTHLLHRLFPSLSYHKIKLAVSTSFKQRQVILDFVNKRLTLENFNILLKKVNFKNFKNDFTGALIFTNQIAAHACFIYGFFKTGFFCLGVASYYCYKNNKNLKTILIIWILPAINISGLTLAAYMGYLESIPLGLHKIIIVVESAVNWVVKQPMPESYETDGLEIEIPKANQKVGLLATSSIPTGSIPPSDEESNHTDAPLPLPSLERSSIRQEPGDFPNRPLGPMQSNPGYSAHVIPGPVSQIADKPYKGKTLDSKSLQKILKNSQEFAKKQLEEKEIEDKKEGQKLAKNLNIDIEKQKKLWELTQIEHKDMPDICDRYQKFDLQFTWVVFRSSGSNAALNMDTRRFQQAYPWRPWGLLEMRLEQALEATRATLDNIVLEKKKKQARMAELREQCKKHGDGKK